MNRGTSRRSFVKQALAGAAAGQPQGSFAPFYRLGAGIPYGMYFDSTG